MTRTKKKTLAVLMALSVVIPGSIAPTLRQKQRLKRSN